MQKGLFRSAHLFTSSRDLESLLKSLPASDPRCDWLRQMLRQIAEEPGANSLADLPL